MTTDTLQNDSAIAKRLAALAGELHRHEKHAVAAERLIEQVRGVIDAIRHGGLLDATPAEPDDREKHITASTLLSGLEDRFEAWDAIEGTDLSIALSVLASDTAKLGKEAR